MDEVEGAPSQPTKCFPFSKPSPFSSMTDWPPGSQHTMTHPPSTTPNVKLNRIDHANGSGIQNHSGNGGFPENDGGTAYAQKRIAGSPQVQENASCKKI